MDEEHKEGFGNFLSATDGERFEIPLVSSACQEPLLCQRPGDIHGYPTEPPWTGQSSEGSAVKLSLHVAHQCCWEGSRTCSTVLE